MQLVRRAMLWCWLRVHRLFLALAAFEVGVDHVSLDRAGAHNGDLDHKVVKCLGFQTRQHIHLRTTFDLKYAERVPLLQHVIDRRVFLFDRGERIGLTQMR